MPPLDRSEERAGLSAKVKAVVVTLCSLGIGSAAALISARSLLHLPMVTAIAAAIGAGVGIAVAPVMYWCAKNRRFVEALTYIGGTTVAAAWAAGSSGFQLRHSEFITVGSCLISCCLARWLVPRSGEARDSECRNCGYPVSTANPRCPECGKSNSLQHSHFGRSIGAFGRTLAFSAIVLIAFLARPQRPVFSSALPREDLKSFLNDPDIGVQYEASKELSRRPASEIMAAITSPETRVRLGAIRAIRLGGLGEHLAQLLGCSADPHPRVRQEAALALESFGSTVPLEQLERWRTREPDSNVQIVLDRAISALRIRGAGSTH